MKNNARPKLEAGLTLTPDCQLLAARISPDGKTLAAAGSDGTLRRWNLAEEKPAELEPLNAHRGWTTDVAFAPDGRLLSADSWGRLACHEPVGAELKKRWSLDAAHDGWIRQIAVDPQGKIAATCGLDGFVRLWSIVDGRKIAESNAHGEDVFAVTFSPDGKQLFSGDLRGNIRRWNASPLKPEKQFAVQAFHKLHRLQNVAGIRRLALSGDAQTLYVAGGEPKNGANVNATPAVHRLSAETGEAIGREELGDTSQGFVFDMHVHADGFLIAVTGGTPGKGQVLLHQPGEKEPFALHKKLANLHAVAPAPDGRSFYAAATNGGSGGNGRKLDKDGRYPNNHSPLRQFTLA